MKSAGFSDEKPSASWEFLVEMASSSGNQFFCELRQGESTHPHLSAELMDASSVTNRCTRQAPIKIIFFFPTDVVSLSVGCKTYKNTRIIFKKITMLKISVEITAYLFHYIDNNQNKINFSK